MPYCYCFRFESNLFLNKCFLQFIDERLDMLNTGLGFSDEFELETLRHSEKMNRRGKHYKDFLKNVKDKVMRMCACKYRAMYI